jgi:hypothetical protein
MKTQKMGNRHDKCNTSEVSIREAKKTIEKTQNMLKSHNVFLFNDILFLNIIFSLFLICFQ